MAEHKSKKNSSQLKYRLCEHMTYSAREALKRLRTNLTIALTDSIEDTGCRIVGITSAQVAEGKSTVAVNLAYSLAELGKRVLLIDTDLRRPSIHTKLDIPSTPGLSELLNGADIPDEIFFRYESSVNSTGFHVLVSGEIPDNPSELLASANFRQLLEALKGRFDYILLDLPPVTAVTDAASIARCTDGMLVVIREKHCPRFVLSDCIEQLRYAKANILGFVVNGCVGSGKRYRYGQSRYAYANSYSYYTSRDKKT